MGQGPYSTCLEQSQCMEMTMEQFGSGGSRTYEICLQWKSSAGLGEFPAQCNANDIYWYWLEMAYGCVGCEPYTDSILDWPAEDFIDPDTALCKTVDAGDIAYFGMGGRTDCFEPYDSDAFDLNAYLLEDSSWWSGIYGENGGSDVSCSRAFDHAIDCGSGSEDSYVCSDGPRPLIAGSFQISDCLWAIKAPSGDIGSAIKNDWEQQDSGFDPKQSTPTRRRLSHDPGDYSGAPIQGISHMLCEHRTFDGGDRGPGASVARESKNRLIAVITTELCGEGTAGCTVAKPLDTEPVGHNCVPSCESDSVGEQVIDTLICGSVGCDRITEETLYCDPPPSLAANSVFGSYLNNLNEYNEEMERDGKGNQFETIDYEISLDGNNQYLFIFMFAVVVIFCMFFGIKQFSKNNSVDQVKV